MRASPLDVKRPMDYVVLVGANLDGGGEGFSGASTILLSMCYVHSITIFVNLRLSLVPN